jgi:cyclase
MSDRTEAVLTSDHFVLEQIAEGVYAAVGRAGGPTASNAGIVDLGSQTLVFDAFELPDAADDLRTAAEHLTGRPASYVILSHSHSDHTIGCQAFGPEVPVLSTHVTREGIPTSADWIRYFKENPDELEQATRDEREVLDTLAGAGARANQMRTIARLEHLSAALPSLEFRLPELTFDDGLVFHGSQRTAELHVVAPGHTPSDAYLLLPKDRVLFMGDLGFFQAQPFMFYCDPEAWRTWLAAAERLEVDHFVPGHGPVGTRADVALLRRFIVDLQALVAQSLEKGLPLEAIPAKLSEPFDAWIDASPARWEANLSFMYERLSGRPVE